MSSEISMWPMMPVAWNNGKKIHQQLGKINSEYRTYPTLTNNWYKNQVRFYAKVVENIIVAVGWSYSS